MLSRGMKKEFFGTKILKQSEAIYILIKENY